MLSSEKGIKLIDFHELLRLGGQTYGKGIEARNRVFIGWNAWRLLCSGWRDFFTKDWISENLITGDKVLAERLWYFFREIKDFAIL